MATVPFECLKDGQTLGAVVEDTLMNTYVSRGFALVLLLGASSAQPLGLLSATYEPCSISPPKLPREFRAAWIATVANIDWPSRPGLTTAEQKAEMIALLDRASQLRLNALIFHGSIWDG